MTTSRMQVTFIGPAQAGKSSLVSVLANPKVVFEHNYISTIGGAFLRKKQIDFWDVSGHERYESSLQTYLNQYHDVVVFTLSADQLMHNGYLHELDKHQKVFQEKCPKDTLKLLIITKSDLLTDANRVIANDRVETLKKKLAVGQAFMCSAKTKAGLNEIDQFLKSQEQLFIQKNRRSNNTAVSKSESNQATNRYEDRFKQAMINLNQYIEREYISSNLSVKHLDMYRDKEDGLIEWNALLKPNAPVLKLHNAFKNLKEKILDDGVLTNGEKQNLSYSVLLLTNQLDKLTMDNIEKFKKDTAKYQTTLNWRVVLGAVIGALIGFVLGASLGLLMGPAAAVPAVFAGVKGAAIGAALAGAGGAIAGGWAVFWNASKNDSLRQIAKSAEEIVEVKKIENSFA